MSAQRPLISFRNVWFRYPGATVEQWAVRDLSFDVDPGQSVAVVGGNGSGKSTLAKLACGLLIPDKGTVTVDGHDTGDAETAPAVHAACGYVFQNPDDQLVESIVEDEAAFGPANLGLARNEVQHRAHTALEAVGLAAFAHCPVASLSGGQKQRLAIAGALALGPQALVLDEAASMLDPRGRRTLEELLDGRRSHGIATVSVTHFMDEALRADRIIALEAGRIACDGAPEDVFGNRALVERLSLEEPLPVALHRLLAERGFAVPFCRSETEFAQAVASLREQEEAR
ncbi:MAG: ATP-binding cassette domain-containing protein [Eggerthellaceae bacterium]|jgi:energy-coupling factor transporter ATPase